ncbi:MBL fold metallo-hydrolase [Aeromicrobium sp. HA]|uniref:MBL fold metallo-hydrolase n=1 Tax=Aeromicrobium sp. HA TaxID=3009077 RepID=UPI0022AF13E8|nr:MBL fold metallo-hydrolase [Aeromicrobium sp. HA]
MSKHFTRVVLLGTAGGPGLFEDQRSCGISTAVVYGESVYLVDLGAGAMASLNRSGVAASSGAPDAAGALLDNVRGIFFTHLHSDHVADWPTLYATAPPNSIRRTDPIRVFGPGPRAQLPRLFPPTRPDVEPINPADPSLGIAGMTATLRNAFAADLNDRIRDTNMADPASRFEISEIDLAGTWDVDAAGVPPRLTRPLDVWVDGDVKVTATLVDHRPTAPAFAYRFDTPDGSIVVSGDTTVSPNLIALAEGADCLVHEVIDPMFVQDITSQLPGEIAAATREHLLASHTTIEQVGRDVAQPAGVKQLVLSHLVPPSGPESRWKNAGRGFDGKVVVGRDLMQFGIGTRKR